MNTLRKQVLIALTVLGMGSVAGVVQAQTSAPPPPPRPAPAGGQHERMAGAYQDHMAGAGRQERMGGAGEMFARHQARIHDMLQLTAAQEPAWATYQAAIRQGAMQMAGQRGGDWAAMAAPARMEKMIAMARQHTATMEAHLASLNAFYAVLTPAQKKAFDAVTMGGAGGGHGGHMMMGRMGH